MKSVRKRLTYANVMSSIAVFLVLAGGTAFAASQLGKESVGSKQLKKEAVGAAKIKKGAVTSTKIGNGAVGAAQLNTAGLTVPNATHADSANHAATADSADKATSATSAGTATSATTATTANTANSATVANAAFSVNSGNEILPFDAAAFTFTTVASLELDRKIARERNALEHVLLQGTEELSRIR